MSSFVELDVALNLWEKAIRERTAVGSRKHVGWKAATTAHLLPCDLENLARQLAETHDIRGERGRRHAQISDPNDEILELRSSAGYSSMSPFEVRTQTYRSAMSATSRSKGRQAQNSRTLGKQAARKQSKMKEAPECQQKQLRQLQGDSQEWIECEGGDGDKEQEEEEEEKEGGNGDRDDEHVENGEKRQQDSEHGESAEVAASIADMQARTQKRKSSQAAEQVSDTSRNKKARLSDEANMVRETANNSSDPSTGSITTGTRPPIHAILDKASSALRSKVPTRSTQHGFVAEDSLQIDTQSEGGEAAGAATDLPMFCPLPRGGSHDVRASTVRLEGSPSPNSAALSTNEFVESVADGSAFKLLEQAKRPTGPEQGCSLCGGVCLFCEVPSSLDRVRRERMYDYAHQAHELERKAEDHTLRKWIRRTRFATPTLGLLQGQGEVCVSCRRRASKARRRKAAFCKCL